MKKSVLSFLLTCSILFGGGIVWQKDLHTAMEKAQTEHKLLMVFVESEHCRWCKKMRYRTLQDDKVIAKLKPYISVRVDEGDRRTMAALPQVDGVPTIFFMTPDNKMIETAVGYFDTYDFLSFFESVDLKMHRN